MNSSVFLQSSCAHYLHTELLLGPITVSSSPTTASSSDHLLLALEFSNHTKTSRTVGLRLQGIGDDLLDHVVSLIRQEVVDELGLVGVTSVVP